MEQLRSNRKTVDDTGRLPVFHIYYPTTFPSVLSSFLNSDLGASSECYLLGLYELRPGIPTTPSVESEDAKSESKPVPSADTSSTSAARLRSSSRVRRTRSGSVKVVKEEDSTRNLRRTPCHNATSCPQVCAVSIVGVTSQHPSEEGLPTESSLQLIGKASLKSAGQLARSTLTAPPSFQLIVILKDTGEISVDKLIWNGRQYPSPSSNTLISFEYDPSEFQRWKLPETYPLGVPQVFLESLSLIQQQAFPPSFTPTFPSVALDHQDLNACTNPPSFVHSSRITSFIFKTSSGLDQLAFKISIIASSLLYRSYPLLPLVNFFLLLLLDSLIGYWVTTYLLRIPNLLGLLHTTVDQMLAQLNHLLRWLRGAPAGLKLNPNLNSLYWRFFSYHIHLWANYIGILEPIFALILHTIQYFGLLGVSVQIGLLKDLLSLATFHVYCLYIYATRLYSLQTTAINALCRVFFGRKYNPLRNRIDHVQLTTPELFLSSFGFVILIFLFPTTMVYYTGFVFLRVPVLLIERTLQYFIHAFNHLPLISWALVYFNSPRVADEIYLLPRISSPSGCLTFRLCLRSTRTLYKMPQFGQEIKRLVGAVMSGLVLKE